MKRNIFISVGLFFCIFAIIENYAFSQWSHHPDSNLVISSVPNSQRSPSLVSDGSGGAIVVWSDFHTEFWKYDIYAQRIDGNGLLQWEKDGVPMCIAVYEQSVPVALSDGAGGAIVAWVDKRNGSHDNIFAQRVDSKGTMLWQENGVPICMAPGLQSWLRSVQLSDGGYVIAWRDQRTWDTANVYAQKVDQAGIIQWTSNGVMVSHANYADPPFLTDDGKGGAIFIWRDSRNNQTGFNLDDIYAQRIDSMGSLQWGASDVLVVGGDHVQIPSTITGDGSGGAIINWNEIDPDFVGLRIQRIDESGSILWGEKGISLDSLGDWCSILFQDNQKEGEVTAIWLRRTTAQASIISQVIDLQGNFQLENGGREVYRFSNEVTDPKILRDNQKNIFISWLELKNFHPNVIKVQKINSAGSIVWPTNGVTLANSNIDYVDVRMVSDGDGGIIATWYDSTKGTDDIFAQRVNKDGNLGTITGIKERDDELPKLFTLNQNFPNPFNPSTIISFQLSVKSFVTISVINVIGERVATLVNELQEAGNKSIEFDASRLPSGMYFYRLTAGAYSETKKMLLLK